MLHPLDKKKCPMHPTKVMDIKVEINKILQAEFIIPIEYTFWVSNHSLDTKK
jgi:hypothetical protein